MRKEITLDGAQVTLEANAATPLRYKKVFPGKDLLRDLDSTETDPTSAVETIARLAFIMMRQADGSITTASEDDFIEWMESLSPETFIGQDALIDVLSVYNKQAAKSIQAKKKARK
jgi:hypothetical protein